MTNLSEVSRSNRLLLRDCSKLGRNRMFRTVNRKTPRQHVRLRTILVLSTDPDRGHTQEWVLITIGRAVGEFASSNEA
ncbi:hypothetical protein SPHINGO391_390242 [Sphingomonas aurantiaca]|uniref:Uncharacterized protein n=1 Tax=Sphingomonas aurantiaca TaxID=185949 RepID=A0A5E7YWS3_9SPHN|nr:hypothetical protein SPHINGO391_390242 [Sphingomonas aurantiaca]